MNKQEYQKALKSPKWLAKRNKIKKRDKYKCTKCGCKDNLHVHHTYYLPNKMPWEVPDECLVTLCKVCHEKEHKDRDIKSFVRTSPPKKVTPIKKSPPKKKKDSRKVRREKAKKKQKLPRDKIRKDLQVFKYIAIKSDKVRLVLRQNDMWLKALDDHRSAIVKGFNNEVSAREWVNK